MNEIFHEVDTFSRGTDLPTYDPKRSEGFWRHLVIRKGSFSGELMLIFSVNSEHEGYQTGKKLIKDFVVNLIKKHSNLVSACILENFGKADIVTGEVVNIFGRPTITENLLGLAFDINPKSFFQTNSYGAELLYKKALEYALSDTSKTD
jgi:tRNA/tmRNA/rRNA uracil-C5-methylase (TrmA/RlmC/RlmD family)